MKFKVGDTVRIIGNTDAMHYAVIPSVGVVVHVCLRNKYEVECTSKFHGGRIRQTICEKDLASKATVL